MQVVEGPVTLDEISQIESNDERAILWIEPESIVGIDYQEVRNNNVKDPDYYKDKDIDNPAFEITDSLIHRYCSLHFFYKFCLSYPKSCQKY